MKRDCVEFENTHPKAKKENRRYQSTPKSIWISYGWSYFDGFMKFDIDDYDKQGNPAEFIRGKPRSEAIISMLDVLGVKYNGIKTEHGVQLFFRVPAHMQKKTVPPWYSVIAIKCEWKFPASDDHIPIKVNGIERKFFKGSLDNNDVDELPFFLYPLQKSKDKPFNLTFPTGDRTQNLGAYLFHLVNKGYSAEQAFEIVRLMNQYVFEKSIPLKTLEAEILNDSTMKKLIEGQREIADKNISHSDVAQEIIDRFTIITVNGDFYSYEGGVYIPFDDGKITHYMTEYRPKLNINFEKEVIRHIKGKTFTPYPEDDGTVNVKNGILTFSNDGAVEFLSHTKEYISFKQFNAIYAPEARFELLDETLFKWFSGDL